MATLKVELGERSYDILIAFDMLPDIGAALEACRLAGGNLAVMTSPTVGALYYEQVAEGLEKVRPAAVGRHDIPDGEENKNPDNLVRAVRWLAEFAPDPSMEPVVLALGGGVVGDLAGFAAASFRRGVPYVQVPTTLLSAVDSSVGGKTAVNLPQGKNLVGAFYQPRLVYIDLATLGTLPAREVRSGVSEIIKYGAILDAEMFVYLEDAVEALSALDRDALMRVVPRCLELKADVVQRDERDRAHVRVCLNFGHTLGHAIEKAGGELNHGECVAIGMIAAARMSAELGLCGPEVGDRIERLIVRAGLPTQARGVELDRVMACLKHDKKFVTGKNRFVLLTEIGHWTEREDIDAELIRSAARAALA